MDSCPHSIRRSKGCVGEIVGDGGVRLLLFGLLFLSLAFLLLGSVGSGGSFCAAGGVEGEEEEESEGRDALFSISSSFSSGSAFLLDFRIGLPGVASGEVDGTAIASPEGPVLPGSFGLLLGQNSCAGSTSGVRLAVVSIGPALDEAGASFSFSFSSDSSFSCFASQA